MNSHKGDDGPGGVRTRARGLGRAVLTLGLCAALVGGGAPDLAAQAADPAGAPLALLVPAIPEAQAAPVARGIYYQGGGGFELPAAVLLAATRDGRGELCTDDRAQLVFTAADGRRQEWSHSFARADRRAIVCLPPQRIELAAGAGSYTVELLLEDRYAHTFSSRPYYLLAAEPRAATAAPPSAQATSSPAPVAQAAAPTVGGADAETATATTPAPPTGTAGSALPAVGGAEAAAGATPAARPAAFPLRAAWFALWCGLGALAAALVGALLLRRRRGGRRAAGGLVGIVDLRDRETGEARTLLLHQFPHGVGITRRPLALRGLGSGEERGEALATIVPGRSGPLLQVEDGPAGVQSVELGDGDALAVGQALELRYRC